VSAATAAAAAAKNSLKKRTNAIQNKGKTGRRQYAEILIFSGSARRPVFEIGWNGDVLK